jgi:hypothetical protein
MRPHDDGGWQIEAFRLAVEGLHDLLGHLLGVAEQHHGVVAEEQLTPGAGRGLEQPRVRAG